MSTEESIQEKKERIAKMTLMDDVFFEAFAGDTKAVQEMLRVILDDAKLEVLTVNPQHAVRNLYGRSVRLDALCKLGNGKLVEIEIQNEDNDDHIKRSFFNAAQIMVRESQTGTKFEKLPHIIIVFIAKFDVFGDGKVKYHLDVVVRETGEIVDCGVDCVFVNAHANDGSKLSRLMEQMQQKEVDDPEFPEITRKVNELKHEKGGIDHMCKIMDEYTEETRKAAFAKGKAEGREEGRAEGKAEGREEGRVEGKAEGKAEMIREALRNGITTEQLVTSFGVTEEEIANIRE